MENSLHKKPSAPILPYFAQPLEANNNYPATSFSQVQINPYQSPNYNQQIPSQFETAQNREDRLRQIVQKYEISERFTSKLQVLHGFKIVYIFDDSGSMNNPLNDSPLNIKGNLMKARRWDELQHYSNISIEIASLFNPKGCDVYFLNNGIVKNVKNTWDLERYFHNTPQGYTPLRETFNSVINDNIQATKESKLLVVIITDGEPTDTNGTKSEVKEFKKCLKNRHPIDNIFVSIVACTDDDKSMKYLEKWDREIKHLDVVDDFRNERDQIRKAKGKEFAFSYGDYAVKSLIGSVDNALEDLDQTECCSKNDFIQNFPCSII